MSECTCHLCCYARKHPQLGPAPHGTLGRAPHLLQGEGPAFAREHFMRVVSMNAVSAKAFAMPDAVKVICAGQADAARYKFGSREYLLFQTWADYEAYLREKAAEKTTEVVMLITIQVIDVRDGGAAIHGTEPRKLLRAIGFMPSGQVLIESTIREGHDPAVQSTAVREITTWLSAHRPGWNIAIDGPFVRRPTSS